MKLSFPYATCALMMALWAAAPAAQAVHLTVQHLYPGLGDVQYQATFEAEPNVGGGLAFFHPFAYRNLEVIPYGSPDRIGWMSFRVEMNSSFTFDDVAGNALRLVYSLDEFWPRFYPYQISSGIPGFDRDRMSFEPGSITLRFAGLTVSEGQVLSFNVTSMPEPGTWALLLVGVAAVSSATRRTVRAT